MTAYLRAARASRALAALTAAATVYLFRTGHPWWAVLTIWAAVVSFLAGRLLNIGHNTLIRERKGTRPA